MPTSIFNLLFAAMLTMSGVQSWAAGALFDNHSTAKISSDTPKNKIPDAKMSVASQPVEARGVWIDKDDLYKGKEYMLNMLNKLLAANFNTIYIPVWHKGYVVYPGSAYVPQDPKIADIDTNYMTWLIAEAHKRGFMVQAWTEYGFNAFYTQDAESSTHGNILDAHPELTAIDNKGRNYEANHGGYFYSLCPVNPMSHEIMLNLLAEIVTKLPVDALNVDRVRFPDENFCFCEHCKAQFKAETGKELTPDIVKTNPNIYYAWRMGQTTAFMEKLSGLIAKVRPEITVTACVWYASDLAKKGQDWPAWVAMNYVDYVLPMIYWAGNDGTVKETVGLTSDPRKVVLGISAEDCDVDEVIRQINMARQMNLGGVNLWFLGKAEPMLERIGAEVFSAPAKPLRRGS